MHIHCIVQVFLAAIHEADNLDENDYYELSKGEPIYYDIDADKEQTALEADSVDCGLNVPATEGFVLKKEEQQSKYQDNPVTERLIGLMVVQEVRTQWNYT